MYVGKRYPFLTTFRWSIRFVYLFAAMSIAVALLFYFLRFDWLMIPWQPISLVGIAVAFYLGFKNNSSYERLWEARKIWGGIVNSSRTFTVMSRDFVSNLHTEESTSEEDLNAIRKTIVHRHVAWLFALTFQLRERRDWEHWNEANNFIREAGDIHPDKDHFPKIKEYLTDEEYQYMMTKGNKASHLLSLQSKHLKELREKGLIDDFRHMELSRQIEEFYALQGKSERIKNFPFPRQYASVNYYFVWIFILMLPFAMLSIFGPLVDSYAFWLLIPCTTLVSWVFILMEMIGDYSENPFEGLYNDVPITSIARGIEIDIRQMLEETDLPGAIETVTDFNILL